MNDLELTFCILAYLLFGLITDMVSLAPLIKEHNESKPNKISLPLIIIILFINLFIYPLSLIVIYINFILDDLKKYFNLD